MNTSFYSFKNARNCFSEGAQFSSDLTFEEWSQKPEDLKAAILFVQFYNQITMAWDKAFQRYQFIDEEDALSIAMQYLQKQVDRNLMTEERFTPQYIYQVAWNAISALGWTRRDQDRSANEVSEVVQTSEGEVSLYDTVVDSQSGDFEEILNNRELMNIIANLDDKSQKVLNHLVNGESLWKVRPSSPTYESDPLANVSVSKKEVPQIIEDLKKLLYSYAVEKGYAFA